MMENCDNVRLESSNIKECSKICELKVREEVDFFDLEGNKKKFYFGAEIAKTKIIAESSGSEEAMKTNTHNSTLTTKMPITTEQNVNIIDEEKNVSTVAAIDGTLVIDTPISVKEIELPTASADIINQLEPAKENDKNVTVETTDNDDDDDDDEEDDDDDDESYQSDEDSQPQLHMQPTHMNHNSNTIEDVSQESDESTTDSDYSDLSGLSDVSGREWKPISARPINWVQKQMHSGANPRELLSQMLPSNAHQIAPHVNDMLLWRLLANILSEPPRRQKLRDVNTFEDVIHHIHKSDNIIVLTGAGVSVSCGIPDFRSSDGIYSRLAKDYPDLPDPQSMFDINYFSRDPRPFYKFAREIYPGQFKPSPCHRFIKLLEQKHKLLRNYTQNIDTLEQVAGIRNVIECHGSFSTASCTKCKLKCSADDIRADIFAQRIPVCHRCQPNVHQSLDASEPVTEQELRRLVENGIMKPDIVFFGEGLPEEFHTVMASDKDKCDLLIVIGSSLKVRPVALIPSSIPAQVPQILINREQLHHLEFDVELLGDSDVIINQLCHRLGNDWKEICFNEKILQESKELLPLEEDNANNTEGEDDATQQLQDTDTQSVKSNASDIALSSAAAYSDSGFESSTSCGIAATAAQINNGATISGGKSGGSNATIEHIKSSILELTNTLSKTKSADTLPTDLLEEPMDDVDFSNAGGFHTFVERLGQSSTTQTCTAANYRHLSVDSSKDSGIQCDSSNSALASSSSTAMCAALLPPITNFGDSGGTNTGINATTDSNLSATQEQCNNSDANNKTADITTAASNTLDLKIHQQRHQSAADRLHEGTYYCHESSSSYVFPGAQVSWSSDSEEDEELDEVHDFEDEDDMNAAPLSPLLPPSVEAEMVNEIAKTATATTTTTTRVLYKRRSSEMGEETYVADTPTGSCENSATATTTTTIKCSAPINKRRRNSSEFVEQKPTSNEDTVSAAFLTTTINTNTSTNSNSVNNSSSTSASNSGSCLETVTTTTSTTVSEAFLQQI